MAVTVNPSQIQTSAHSAIVEELVACHLLSPSQCFASDKTLLVKNVLQAAFRRVLGYGEKCPIADKLIVSEIECSSNGPTHALGPFQTRRLFRTLFHSPALDKQINDIRSLLNARQI